MSRTWSEYGDQRPLPRGVAQRAVERIMVYAVSIYGDCESCRMAPIHGGEFCRRCINEGVKELDAAMRGDS